MDRDQAGREDLVRWREAFPSNYYETNPNLARVLSFHLGSRAFRAVEPRLREFGRQMAEVVDPSVQTVERFRQLPALLGHDAFGTQTELIDFHPAYHRAAEAVWNSGMLVAEHEGEGVFELVALFYLLSHAGEGGQACPVVCTIGLARALEHRGSPELQRRYLGGLRSSDYQRCHRGSQFLTEVQGGSDVGANAAIAAPGAEAGAWRISGEKWFCSVADADLFAITARPIGAAEGTAGLGCFLVPRTLDGQTPNNFRIRRLKDKLGTRALPSAEIEFDGAVGWAIGPVDEGFHVAVEELLDTSRWLNAVGSTGIMRRTYLEAATFASSRQAFGRAIASFPIVREQLADMKSKEYGALASTLALTKLIDRIGREVADENERSAYRLLVNANKYVTSIDATDVVHQGIEVLGGNGTIEDFSPLPRLYRDSIVFESWEGTHNVLCAQVQRDCVRLGLLDRVLAWQRAELASAGEGAGGDGLVVADASERVGARLKRSLADVQQVSAHFRRQLGDLVRVIQATCLLVEAANTQDPEKTAVASFFIRRQLLVGYQPEDDPEWSNLVDRVLGDSD